MRFLYYPSHMETAEHVTSSLWPAPPSPPLPSPPVPLLCSAMLYGFGVEHTLLFLVVNICRALLLQKRRVVNSYQLVGNVLSLVWVLSRNS